MHFEDEDKKDMEKNNCVLKMGIYVEDLELTIM